MRAPLLLAATVALVAGCTVGELLGAPEGLAFEAPFAVSTTAPGAEPVIAVGADGVVYVEGIGNDGDGNVNKVWRCDAARAECTDITPTGPGTERSNDGYVAVSDDGTVYAANVFSLTFQVYRSEDQGRTWTHLTLPPLPPLMHRHWILPVGDVVHVAIEALPPSFVPYLGGAPPLPTEQATDTQAGMWYTRSEDGGDTWAEPVQIDPLVNFAGQSNMVASADGEGLYVGRYQEETSPPQYSYDDGHWYLLVSEDGGDTWERREMFDLTSEMSTAVPGLALGRDGTLWYAWTQETEGRSQLFVASSPDGGATWSAPSRPVRSNGTMAMAWAAAAPDGRVGIMWYEAPANETASQVDAEWSVWYAEIRDGLVDGPVLVTPQPVHSGNICAKGPACQEGEDRTLLDYPWMDFSSEGKAHLVFPSTKWERPSAFAMVAVQR